jgi:hypothetical protein
MAANGSHTIISQFLGLSFAATDYGANNSPSQQLYICAALQCRALVYLVYSLTFSILKAIFHINVGSRKPMRSNCNTGSRTDFISTPA